MAEKRWGVNNSTVVFMADFIRSVLGTTGPIPGADLDPQLREAVSKVGSGGGGGGSLPTGAYWGVFDALPRPLKGAVWVPFELNGELYAFSAASSSETADTLKYKYKWVNGAWEQLADETHVGYSLTQATLLELDGKLHISLYERSFHYVFDGTTLTQLNNFPGSMSYGQVFVQDGKLKAVYSNKVYVWNETDDTWTAEASIPSGIRARYAVVVDGVVYMNYGSSIYPGLYTYANGVFTQVEGENFPVFGGSDWAEVIGKKMYYRPIYDNGYPLRCYNFQDGTDVFLTKVPSSRNNRRARNFQDKLIFFAEAGMYGSDFQLYEVEATE